MRIPTLLAAPILGAALVGVTLAPAHAAGQSERGPEHANSICSFSGLNDDPDDPVEGGRVQSYGQIVAAGHKGDVPSPGEACNGHLVPWQEVGGGGE